MIISNRVIVYNIIKYNTIIVSIILASILLNITVYCESDIFLCFVIISFTKVFFLSSHYTFNKFTS